MQELNNGVIDDSDDALIALIYQSVLEPVYFPMIMERLAKRAETLPEINNHLLEQSLSIEDLSGINAFDAAFDPESLANLRNKASQEAQAFNQILQHFKRAMSLTKKFVDLEQHDNVNNQLIDTMPIAVFLVDNTLGIINSNQKASDLLQNATLLSVENNVLNFSDRKTHQRIATAVASLSVPKAIEQTSERFDIPNSKGEILKATLFPQRPNQIAEKVKSNVYIMLSELKTMASLSVASFAKRYQLSNKELQIAQSLVLGKKAADIAEDNGTSIHTVRPQIKKLMQKTGTRSQAELVALAILDSQSDRLHLQQQDQEQGKTKLLTLSNGRNLSYGEYGSLKSDANPVIFCHGIPGCHVDHPDIETLIKHNIRLLVPDRPGYSFSDPHPQYSLMDWSKDIEEFADRLQLDNFSVLAADLSSAFALSLGAGLTNRIQRIVILDGVGPPEYGFALKKSNLFYTLIPRLTQASPTFIKYLTYMAFRNFESSPEKIISIILSFLEPENRAVMKQPKVFNQLKKISQETLRQGSAAIAQSQILALSKWRMDLQSVNCPVVLLCSNITNLVSLHAEQLEKHLPNATRIDLPNSSWARLFYEEFELVAKYLTDIN